MEGYRLDGGSYGRAAGKGTGRMEGMERMHWLAGSLQSSE